MGHEMQHTFEICPEGFVVTESDISHALLERVRERLQRKGAIEQMTQKLLSNMLLDLETLKLVSFNDLTEEAKMTPLEARCLLLEDDREWEEYKKSPSQATLPSDPAGGGHRAIPAVKAEVQPPRQQSSGFGGCVGSGAVDGLVGSAGVGAVTERMTPAQFRAQKEKEKEKEAAAATAVHAQVPAPVPAPAATFTPAAGLAVPEAKQAPPAPAVGGWGASGGGAIFGAGNSVGGNAFGGGGGGFNASFGGGVALGTLKPFGAPVTSAAEAAAAGAAGAVESAGRGPGGSGSMSAVTSTVTSTVPPPPSFGGAPAPVVGGFGMGAGPTFSFNKVPEAATGGASLATPAIPAAPQATARPAMPSAVPPATAEISSADKAAVASAQAEATAASAAVPATPAPSTAAMPAAPAGGPGPVEATAPVAAAEEEELDAAPDSNDNDLMELVEYVLTKIKRPKAGLEQEQQFNMRLAKLDELLQDHPRDIYGWTNAEARANRDVIEAFKDPEGGSGELGFRADEMSMLLELLYKPPSAAAQAAAAAAAAAAAVPRAARARRPKAIQGGKYGEIQIRPMGMASYECKGVLGKWSEIEGFEQSRQHWARAGGLVPMSVIVQAIDEYGRQSEWSMDEEGKSYTVRPIQGATLPVSLRGFNLIATAETGSGKTMCFAVASIAAVDVNSGAGPQVLIMAHNRTLLDQLCDEMDKLIAAIKTLRPGSPPITWSYVDNKDSTKQFNADAHVILSTAGQLANKVKRDLNVRGVKLVVADEVDDILSSSAPAMRDILQGCAKAAGKPPQVLFFSATIGDDENDPDDRRLRQQLVQCVGSQHVLCKAKRKDVAGMTHLITVCPDGRSKMKMLAYFLKDTILLGSAIVFCKNKKGNQKDPVSVTSLMDMDNGIRERRGQQPLAPSESTLDGVQEFHAGAEVTRDDRIRMMSRFRQNKARILVATDAVAKGIDVPNVTMVVQMELVKAKTEREGFSWIDNQKKALDQFRHRSGRTARALQKGINIVLCTPDEENKAMEYMRILDIPETNRRVLRIDASGQLPEDINTFLGDAQV